MSSKSLDKLEKLAGNRVEQTRVTLMREITRLEHLERHIVELHSLNTDYQQSVVGQTHIAPQCLAHRREFVGKLTEKLEELIQDKEQMSKIVDETSTEFKRRRAQHSAIDLINEQRKELLLEKQIQREQKQLDEIASAQHLIRSRLKKENYDE